MVISQVIGGLGNQMFQYAAGRALAMRLGGDLALDISAFENYNLHQGFELTRVFAMSPAIASGQDLSRMLGWQHSPLARSVLARRPFAVLRSRRFVSEPHFHYCSDFDQLDGDVYLAGYWQSEKYFKRVIAQIREDFRFRLPLEGENAELAARLSQTQAVSLHVRRGDYASNSATTAVHGLCSPTYYHDALRIVRQQIPDAHLYIFSDDIGWVRKNIKIELPSVYVEHNQGKDSFNDMMLMSLCRHHITANSSFSWWGAWLNSSSSKLVIAPKKWFADDKSTADLIPHQWMRL